MHVCQSGGVLHYASPTNKCEWRRQRGRDRGRRLAERQIAVAVDVGSRRAGDARGVAGNVEIVVARAGRPSLTDESQAVYIMSDERRAGGGVSADDVVQT